MRKYPLIKVTKKVTKNYGIRYYIYIKTRWWMPWRHLNDFMEIDRAKEYAEKYYADCEGINIPIYWNGQSWSK